MRSNGKLLLCLAAYAVLALLLVGCGGFRGSQGVSPATFLVPGILRVDPPPATPDRVLPAEQPLNQVAQN